MKLEDLSSFKGLNMIYYTKDKERIIELLDKEDIIYSTLLKIVKNIKTSQICYGNELFLRIDEKGSKLTLYGILAEHTSKELVYNWTNFVALNRTIETAGNKLSVKGYMKGNKAEFEVILKHELLYMVG